jgi:hypothetical protein
MVLLKSILTGLVSVAAAMLAIVLYAQGLKYRLAMSAPAGGAVFVDVGVDFRAILVTSVLMFAAGFWWRYRKALVKS